MLACMLLASTPAQAANKPCSGKKGGISHCMGKFFVCKDGSTSQSKKDCRTYTGAVALSAVTHRSPAVVAAFRRQQPCPSTGRYSGACPGYQVDHRAALMCGGVDALHNLQWLTVAQHAEKTRGERRRCTRGASMWQQP